MYFNLFARVSSKFRLVLSIKHTRISCKLVQKNEERVHGEKQEKQEKCRIVCCLCHMVHKVCLIGTVSVMQWYLGYEVFSGQQWQNLDWETIKVTDIECRVIMSEIRNQSYLSTACCSIDPALTARVCIGRRPKDEVELEEETSTSPHKISSSLPKPHDYQR